MLGILFLLFSFCSSSNACFSGVSIKIAVFRILREIFFVLGAAFGYGLIISGENSSGLGFKLAPIPLGPATGLSQVDFSYVDEELSKSEVFRFSGQLMPTSRVLTSRFYSFFCSINGLSVTKAERKSTS